MTFRSLRLYGASNLNRKMSSSAIIRYSFQRSAIAFNSASNLSYKKWILCNRIFSYTPILAGHRSICVTPRIQKKKVVEPEAEVLVHKTNQRSTNKKTLNEKKMKPKATVWGVIDVYRCMTVENLANLLKKSIDEMQEVLLYFPEVRDISASAQLENLQVIKEIAGKCGYKVRFVASPFNEDKEEVEKDVHPRPPPPPENLKSRPPVVTVMGHVDHGKTTLLDTLRGASVAENEAGGITQHIGAFTVQLENGERVTFLDTPGHAAFSSMRARGAHCTDIIVLVVAAEDGVMPQTKEVINLAKDGNVPLVVAINKIDAPGANIEAAKSGLLKMGINLEGYGGDVQCVPISALHATNLNLLADAITTQSTLMDLKGEYSGSVEGVVIESKTDPRRGKLSTMIVTRGTLRKGCILVAGLAHAKVRGMFDHNNQPIDVVTPGMPTEILGWRELPAAGDIVLEVQNEKKATSVLHFRESVALQKRAEMDLDAINAKREQHNTVYQGRRKLTKRQKKSFKEKTYAPDDPTPKLNVILKTDVHGSLEAILDVFDTYDSAEKCRFSVVHYGVGPINDGDIELAKTFDAIIYAFSIDAPKTKPKDVIIREFNIIYRLFENVVDEINDRLPEIDVDDVIGEAEVQQIFLINERNRKVPVLGCRCIKGVLKKKLRYKIMRENDLIYDGEISSMRHLKNEVDSIKKNVECGLQLDDISIEVEAGDTVICYTTKKEQVTIDWKPGF